MKKRSITILYNSPVILTFALLSLLALGLGKLTDGWTTQNLFCVYRSPLTDWLTYPRFFLHKRHFSRDTRPAEGLFRKPCKKIQIGVDFCTQIVV